MIESLSTPTFAATAWGLGWATFALGDTYSTRYALRRGGTESVPLSRRIIEDYGYTALLAAKTVAIIGAGVTMAFVASAIDDPHFWFWLGLGGLLIAILGGSFTLNNLRVGSEQPA